MRNIPTYLIALIITVAVFATALLITNQISKVRVSQLQGIEEKIATDILSLETQFDLLAQVSCEDIAESPLLSRELALLGDRLQATEGRLGADNEEVIQLKKQYSLLQIKDQLLLDRITEQCSEVAAVPVLYFYANDCSDCTRAGYALTKLRNDYEDLRVYSFDYDLDLGALQTLIAIHNITREDLPAFIIDGEYSNGFSTLDDLTSRLPVSLTATSTPEI